VKGILKNVLIRLLYLLILTSTYVGYIVIDYRHHLYLEKNVSKNMDWLGYFRFEESYMDFKYSSDLVFLTIVYVILIPIVLFYKRKRGVDPKS